MDKLEEFRDWWIENRIIHVPFDKPMMHEGVIAGAVLYRAAPWQVQLFVLEPNSFVAEHRHPNVDSFEVYLSGDIEFSLNGDVVTTFDQSEIPGFTGRHELAGHSIRVLPDAWHGARTGPRGGVFLSVQQWLNGARPGDVGADWVQKEAGPKNKAIS